MKKVLFIFFVFSSCSILAQDTSRVNAYLKILSDSSFYGRGYINNGSNLAAEFLKNEFRKIGLKKPKQGYLQEFGIRVNTYPEELKIRFNEQELISGYDFIVNPRTGSSSGNYPTRYLDSTYFQAEASVLNGDTVAIIDMDGIDSPDEVGHLFDFKQETLKTKPIVLLEEKLTWSVGQQAATNVELNVLKTSISKSDSIVEVEVKNEMKDVTVANVVGYIPGKRSDSTVVLTAHYDHLGMMGSAIFPGASDNATGTSMLLDLANYYSSNRPEFTTWFIAFAGEEAGLVGSKFFVDHPLFELNQVKLLINLDLMGSASDGIAVVNGKKYPSLIDDLSDINTKDNLVDRIKVRGQAANSDHYWFAESGVPAIFIYTMGNIKAYHDVHDNPKVVDWARYPEVFNLITKFISTL